LAVGTPASAGGDSGVTPGWISAASARLSSSGRYSSPDWPQAASNNDDSSRTRARDIGEDPENGRQYTVAVPTAGIDNVGMNLIERDTELILEPAAPARAAVIWLHGLGADGHDFVPIVPELRLAADHGIRFVFPHAPERAVTINGGLEMRAWYDIPSLTNLRQQDDKGIRDSERLVGRYLDEQREAGIPASKTVLAGFSQGGAITLHTGLRRREKLAGLLVLSSYLPLSEQFAAEAVPPDQAPPIFMSHGTQDPVLPLALGVASRDALRELGYTVDWRDYPMGHSVCEEQVADIAQWLTQRLLG
jgi:phospholipase/carboxylesterase